ncbi:MAG TPA: L-seryl-tRNA(Sec) selenium transferase [Hyphomicrobiaceae bacterium]|nr:L-seryl-tRNA(Sec) selenium transferase [Hyphomicrobiaceae bacterium]
MGQPRLPSVHQVLNTPTGRLAAARFGHEATVSAIRRAVAAVRGGPVLPDASAVATGAIELLEQAEVPSLRRVFNLTGTVLHTNLGRALLADAAVAAATDAMRSAVALEFDLGGAARGERDDHVRGLLRELTGAEDACIVNNNAAAVLLALNTLAAGRGAVVSRGELIEIGGSFRLPDIMARAGARLVEVGTTNRTHLKDYEQAVGAETGIILKAHTSNYLIQGFTKSVSATELAALARARAIPFLHDLGSGALVDLARYGLRSEPTVWAALAEGADLVTFSGDKLLGGPQAGIVAGRRDLVALIASNPMKRAVRLDKVRMAALEATLKLYRNPDTLPQTLPTLRHFVRSRAEITALAERLARSVAAAAGEHFQVSVVDCASQIGSGALPLETLQSAGLAIAPVGRKGAGTRLEALAAGFRNLPVPVVGHLKDGALVFDLRCLDDEPGFLAQLDRLEAPSDGGNSRDVSA